MTILITGATGQVGGAAARALLAQGVAVRALVRNPERAATQLAGAELVRGTFEDGAALAAALDGVDTLFLMSRDSENAVAQWANALRLAEEAGVRHIVKLSAIGAAANSPVQLMCDHHLVDERLQAGHLRWTLIRPHLYLQNLLRAVPELHHSGRLIAAMAHEALPLVDTRDVGAAAAAILQNPAPHAGKIYRLTGPQALTYDDVAAALSPLLGRAIRYEAFNDHDYESWLRTAGVDGQRAFDLAHILLAYEPADRAVSADFEQLTGRKPTALAAFLADYRAQFTD